MEVAMRQIDKLLICSFSALLLFLSCSTTQDADRQLNKLFSNKQVTILVTDSGLGGLSVAADVASRLPQSGVFEKANIVFFNSLFHNRSGYNSLESEEEKVRIFDTALSAMTERYNPDLLLIACNTLSVLYEHTDYAKNADIPVVGIVETGVDLIARQFDKTPEATAIIFATRTTIGSESHKKLLVQKGYPSGQIVGQACHRLPGAIERGYNSEETQKYIRGFVPEGLEKVTEPDTPIFVSLNCTHYGYSMEVWREVFAEAGYPDVVIIDPNLEMANFLFDERYLQRYPKTEVTVEVVSKVKVSAQKRNSLGSLLSRTSEKTTQALVNYQYDPELFDAQFDSTTIGR